MYEENKDNEIMRQTFVEEFPERQARYLETLTQTVKEHPFISLGVAAGAGYIMAGGLPTAFTGRLIRNGMRTVVPFAAQKLKAFSAATNVIMDRK